MWLNIFAGANFTSFLAMLCIDALKWWPQVKRNVSPTQMLQDPVLIAIPALASIVATGSNIAILLNLIQLCRKNPKDPELKAQKICALINLSLYTAFMIYCIAYPVYAISGNLNNDDALGKTPFWDYSGFRPKSLLLTAFCVASAGSYWYAINHKKP